MICDEQLFKVFGRSRHTSLVKVYESLLIHLQYIINVSVEKPVLRPCCFCHIGIFHISVPGVKRVRTFGMMKYLKNHIYDAAEVTKTWVIISEFDENIWKINERSQSKYAYFLNYDFFASSSERTQSDDDSDNDGTGRNGAGNSDSDSEDEKPVSAFSWWKFTLITYSKRASTWGLGLPCYFVLSVIPNMISPWEVVVKKGLLFVGFHKDLEISEWQVQSVYEIGHKCLIVFSLSSCSFLKINDSSW